MTERRIPVMPGGLTRREFDVLRDDLKELLADHPGARFTIVLVDEEGKATEDPMKAKRYGLTVHEGEELLFEEFGDADWTEDAP